MERYYVFTYRDNCGGGKRYILADSKRDALQKLKAFLEKHHPNKEYQIELYQTFDAPKASKES